MIVVITGMEIHPFDRLIRAVDQLVESGRLQLSVFIQRGHTPYQPKAVPYEDFLTFGDLRERIEASRLVITHAGAGSTLTCLQCRKRPIVVPRQARYGEHVDDHQLPFAKRLADFGLVRQVLDIDDLPDAIEGELLGTSAYVAERSGGTSGIVTFLEEVWSKRARG